jgi:hypothetical protein
VFKITKLGGSIILGDYTDNNGVVLGGLGLNQIVNNNIDSKIWKIIKYSSIDFFLHNRRLFSTRIVYLKKIISKVNESLSLGK